MTQRKFTFTGVLCTIQLVVFGGFPFALLLYFGIVQALIQFGFKADPKILRNQVAVESINHAKLLDAYYSQQGVWPKSADSLASARDTAGKIVPTQWTTPVPGSAVARLAVESTSLCHAVEKLMAEREGFVLAAGWEVRCVESATGPGLLLAKLSA